MTTPTSVRTLAESFLMSSQAMADAILQQIQKTDPERAEQIATAVAHGAKLSMAFTFGEAESSLELLIRLDDKTLRVAAFQLDQASVTKPRPS